MQMTLTPELEALLNQQLETGRFEDLADVVKTAVHAMSDSRALGFGELNALIDEGIEAADHEDGLDGTQARAYLQAMRAKI